MQQLWNILISRFRFENLNCQLTLKGPSQVHMGSHFVFLSLKTTQDVLNVTVTRLTKVNSYQKQVLNPHTWHVTNGANFKYWQAKVINNLSSINIYADGTPQFWLFSNHLAYNPHNHWYQLEHSLAGPAPFKFFLICTAAIFLKFTYM